MAWNIRELRNVLTRLSLRNDTLIEAADVENLLRSAPSGTQTFLPASNLRELTRARIKAAHRDANGNLSEAARRLGVSRDTVYRAIGSGDASV